MNYQMPPFEPLHFVPAKDRQIMLDLPIWRVDAVAHDPLDNGGNHWCFYLNVTDTTSVQIDMTPSYNVPGVTNPNGSKGILIISYLEHAVSISTTAQKAVQNGSSP
ncbi:glyceraldehyde-3-phosphate dehydrogenase, type I [Aspergillus niger]|uniref:Glyceraldehyde-3-phosphate dehydrogenase, type I n=1 Tax=Aspergillus niger TaxID=5061 RepID=A0A505I2S2_ASPNG|nr:glyceraldehyde-3-phosphate dehydrogenase, type I [Aspergillus niger]